MIAGEAAVKTFLCLIIISSYSIIAACDRVLLPRSASQTGRSIVSPVSIADFGEKGRKEIPNRDGWHHGSRGRNKMEIRALFSEMGKYPYQHHEYYRRVSSEKQGSWRVAKTDVFPLKTVRLSPTISMPVPANVLQCFFVDKPPSYAHHDGPEPYTMISHPRFLDEVLNSSRAHVSAQLVKCARWLNARGQASFLPYFELNL